MESWLTKINGVSVQTFEVSTSGEYCNLSQKLQKSPEGLNAYLYGQPLWLPPRGRAGTRPARTQNHYLKVYSEERN